jgi:catechol 2,3-dioxygenase-like lactoylglutathione lyase family enzyme
MNDPTTTAAPPLNGVIETALYVDDPARSVEWYRRVMGLRLIFDGGNRLQAMAVAEKQVLLLFRKGASSGPIEVPGGRIPSHDGDGHLHVAFAVSLSDLEAWRTHLKEQNVPVASEVKWGEQGRSLYFHDPDGHVVEVITPGFWDVY